jgi:uncharacterized membrane protein YoaK (UPF0700 family)
MTRDLDGRRAGRAVAAALFVQATALFLATALALGSGNGPSGGQTPLYLAIALTAVAMGVQNVTARNIAVPGLSPNVLTGALTGVAGDAPLSNRDPVWTRRLASVAVMFAGAFVGAWLWHVSSIRPLAIAAVVSAVCGLAIAGDESTIAMAL